MGLMKKAANFTVVSIDGLKDLDVTSIKESLSRCRIKDIKGTGDAQAFGFCKIDDAFEFDLCFSDGLIGVGLRFDKKQISKTLFKKLYKAELKKQNSGLGISTKKKKRLTKEEKQFVKEEVMSRLYAEAVPLEKVFEVILNYKEGKAFIGAIAPAIVDGFGECLRRVIPTASVSVWSPEPIDNDTKGSKENYQNALFTWILHKSVAEPKRQWIPHSATFFDGSSTVTVKSDSEFPTEAFFSSYKDRVVDALKFSVEKEDRQMDVSLSRGSWGFKQVKFKPEVVHEDADSALFERYSSLDEVVTNLKKIVDEFGEIRGTKKEQDFWTQVHKDAKEKIKLEVQA
jgi:hypothetical protein